MVGEPVMVSTEETQEQRLQAIACYASQVPMIFHFSEDLRGAVVNFALGGWWGAQAHRALPIIVRANL
jgi:LmbE family N-acetylglucosaminyl deacetylase